MGRVLILLAVLGIGALQQMVPADRMHWIYVLQRLYYVPIALAGLSMGWRGGLGVAVLAAVSYAIGTPPIWGQGRANALDVYLEVGVFCLVGGLSGVLTDRQKKQERALRMAKDQLGQAHRELEENFETMKRAEKIYALAQLSSGLAHEIRNPLASLEGAATVVQRENQSEERRREFLGIIQTETRRLNRLLTSFLQFAKPREPDWETVDIGEVLESVILLAEHAGKTDRIELQKQIHAGLPVLECDPEQLKQVLLNLVMNAIEAMPLGGTVLLEAQRTGTNVSIDIHDQGTGISKEDLDRIFDPFFTTKETGTGLGLSIAHQIVSQHQGMLTIVRNSPEGTTIRVSLPLRPRHI